MALSRTFSAALAGFAVAAVAFAADTTPSGQAACGANHGHGMMAMLTPDERLMMFVQMHQETANMTADQRKDFRKSQHEKFRAMTDGDRQKFAAGLQAKWDALPADRKAKIKEQADNVRSGHARMGKMMGGGC
jgi:hypothetical protein